MIGSANMAWSMYPSLCHGAYHALYMHADAATKQLYLPKLLAGTWAGTMCLTESNAGSSVGDNRAKAIPIESEPGVFEQEGEKIFICS
jgi:alkylation response protein AidB-like acyl-CoA dehydrogenase